MVTGDEEDYKPARRPPGEVPGGDRVRFEREGEYEQAWFGGGAQDIVKSVLSSTERNIDIIGWTIMGVSDVVGEMGAGTLQSLTLMLEREDGRKRQLKIEGIGMNVEIS